MDLRILINIKIIELYFSLYLIETTGVETIIIILAFIKFNQKIFSQKVQILS